MANDPKQTTITGRYIGGGLFEPKADQNNPEKKRYNACIILDDKEHKKIDKVINVAIEEKWGKKKPAGLQIWGAREGDDEEYEASYGNKFINPKSTKAPEALTFKDGVYVKTDSDEGVIYPGCYVGVSVQAYAYDGDKKKNIKPGVSLNLRAVLFREDGEHLDDHVNAENEFAGVNVVESDNDNTDDDDFLAA